MNKNFLFIQHYYVGSIEDINPIVPSIFNGLSEMLTVALLRDTKCCLNSRIDILQSFSSNYFHQDFVHAVLVSGLFQE